MTKVQAARFTSADEALDFTDLEGTMLCHVPLVAVTAYAMVGDREKVLAAGFDAYLTKPINPETFVRDIERHLGGRA